MTYLDAYVTTTHRVVGLGGEAPEDDTWPGKPVPWFPPDHGYGTAFFAIRDGVQSGRWPGIQVDWGSWAARMTRAEIEQFIDEIYGPGQPYSGGTCGGGVVAALSSVSSSSFCSGPRS